MPGQSAHRWFERQGLPFPPLPPTLEQALAPRTETLWSTADAPDDWWDVSAVAERAAVGERHEYAVAGFGGRGLASNALYFLFCSADIGIFMEHSYGNVGNRPEEVAEIGADYELLRPLVDGSSQAGDRAALVVYKSTLRARATIWHGTERRDHRTFEVLDVALALDSPPRRPT